MNRQECVVSMQFPLARVVQLFRDQRKEPQSAHMRALWMYQAARTEVASCAFCSWGLLAPCVSMPVREHALYPMHTPFTPLALGKRASQARNSESGAPAYDVILALEHDRGGCVGISRPSSQKDCGRPVGLRLIGSPVARDSHLCAAQ